MSVSYAQRTVLDVKDTAVKGIKVPAPEGSDNTHNKLVKYIAYQKVIGAKEKVAMGERSKEKWGCRVNNRHQSSKRSHRKWGYLSKDLRR